MADQSTYRDVMLQLGEVKAAMKSVARVLQTEVPTGSAAVLTMLSQHGALTISELTAHLGVDISVTSRHVSYLTDEGWIDRSPNPADGRYRILHLTDAGKAQLNRLSDKVTEMFADRLHDWDDSELDQLIRLMGKLHDSLCDVPTAGTCTPSSHSLTHASS